MGLWAVFIVWTALICGVEAGEIGFQIVPGHLGRKAPNATTNVIATMGPVRNQAVCAGACLTNHACASFNYIRSDSGSACEIMNTKDGQPIKTDKASDFYWIVKGRPGANECQENLCLNSGVCAAGNVTPPICQCLPGFSGDRCQQCQSGLTGPNCDIEIYKCLSDPCQNGASCIEGVQNYTCLCAAGYTSDHCQTDIDECVSAPCANGATCNHTINNFTCTCATGYTGLQCEQATSQGSMNAGIYVIGNSASDFPINRLNPDSGTVEVLGPGYHGSMSGAGALPNGTIIFHSFSGTFKGVGWYDTISDTASSMNILPNIFYNDGSADLEAVAALAGDMFVFCGVNDAGNSKCVLYDTVYQTSDFFTLGERKDCVLTINVYTQFIEQVATMEHPDHYRMGCTSFETANDVVYCGGEWDGEWRRTCRRLDLANPGAWTSFPSMVIERRAFTLVNWKGVLYTVGDTSNCGYYDRNAGYWQTTTWQMPFGRTHAGVAAIIN